MIFPWEDLFSFGQEPGWTMDSNKNSFYGASRNKSLRNLLICYINVFSQEPLNRRHFLFCFVCLFVFFPFAAFLYYLQTFQDIDSTILSRSYCEKKQSLELSFNKFRKHEQTKLINHQ